MVIPPLLLEIIFINGAIIHGSPDVVARIEKVINAYPNLLKDQGFVNLPEDN